MGKYCPILKEKVTYLVCLECDEENCEDLEKREREKEKEREKKKTQNFKTKERRV